MMDLNHVSIGSEYKGTCIYCGSNKLRMKHPKDWKRGEHVGRGHFPDTFIYYYCDSCHKTSIRRKPS